MRRSYIIAAGFISLLVGLAVVVFEPRATRNIWRQMDDALRRMAAKPIQSASLVVLDIDDESLGAFGQWPWPRTLLAEIAERFWKEGASIVAWDVVFAEPDRTSPARMVELWRAQFEGTVSVEGIPPDRMDHDELFARALRQGRSVLSFYGELSEGGEQADALPSEPFGPNRIYEIGESSHRWLPAACYVVRPIPVLRHAAESEAFFNTLSDDDNIVRRTPLVLVCGDRILPALSLEVFRLCTGADSIALEWDRRGWGGVAGLRVGRRSIATDPNGYLWLNYRSEPFRHVSLVEWWRGGAQVSLSNAIVFVGTSAAGLRDLVGTPMGPDVPGVEVHATALDNMLAGDMLRFPTWLLPAKLASITVAGLVLIVLIARARAVLAMIVTMMLLAIGWYVSRIALESRGWLFSPSEYSATLLLIYVAMTTAKYAAEEQARRRVRKMFSAMVSSDVLTYLETHPEDVSLRGRRVEATVFFSDINNFTALAERLDPEELTQWMNRYLTPMADAIMAEGGYVDKFNGDAVMAVWGAPFPVEDHAMRACRAALEQLRRLEDLQRDFRERFGMELQVRMGINTGWMTAGNMGSNRRHQYTVMGDVVNVAARLQDANKDLGTTILIGEETWQRVRDQLSCRPVGSISVRGRAAPVMAYELMK